MERNQMRKYFVDDFNSYVKKWSELEMAKKLDSVGWSGKKAHAK